MIINYNYLIIVIVLVIVLVIIYFKKKEHFMENNITNVTINIFNEIFDSELVILPNSMTAIGFFNNNIYLYSNLITINTYDKIKFFIDYWIQYIHPNLNKNKYYIIYDDSDGIRELTKYFEGELKLYKPLYNEFENKGEIVTVDNSLYPILHKNIAILCNSKIINDIYSLCVPDRHYIHYKGYKENFKKIDENNIDFDKKIPECIYRGNINNGWYTNFFNPEGKFNLIQRQYLMKLKNEKIIKKLNFTTDFASIEDQIKYKYILDIDGYSSTWDATVWKLYSGSVLLKTKSVWKQWYYDSFHEWVHYVPVENDFSDLDEKIQWCIDNDDKCKEITMNAKKLVLEKLNWDQVISDTVESVKDII